MSVITESNTEAPTQDQVVHKLTTEYAFANVAELRRTPHSHRFESLHVFTDFFLAFLTTLLVLVYANAGRWNLLQPFLGRIEWSSYWQVLALYPVLIVVCCKQQRLYRRFPNPGVLEDGLAVLKAVTVASLVLTSYLFLRHYQSLTPAALGSIAVGNVIALSTWRILGRHLYAKKVGAGTAGSNVLIIGADKLGRALAAHLSSNRDLGYIVKGFLDESRSYSPGVLGRVDDLPRIAREEYADEVFITIPATSDLAKRTILNARKLCLDVTVVPDLFDGLGFQAPLEYVGEFPVMELHREPIPTIGLITKRAMDILFVSLALIVAIPLVVLLAACIYLDSPGPIFYTSRRVGKKGRPFGFYKLRSMVNNAEALREELEIFNEREGFLFKMANDPRVTRVGRFIRKYSLDELPQFWNVLKGDMSLVGPRPPLVTEYQKYKLEHRRRLDVVPGLTGLWQVSGRKDPSFEGYLSLDLKYIENWNLLLDLEILLRTVPAVLRGTGH